MRWRRLLLVVGAVALLGLAGLFLFLWLTSPTPGVTWNNFRRMRVGMSAKDVEALLGDPYDAHEFMLDGLDPLPVAKCKYWRGKDVIIALSFDTADWVVAGEAAPREEDFVNNCHVEEIRPENLLDRLHRWLHW